jgi:hypothetical protein
VVRPIAQLAVMAAVVATLFYVPVGLAMLLILRAFGVPFESVASFGGALGTVSGLFAWWLVAFIPACVYTLWFSRT